MSAPRRHGRHGRRRQIAPGGIDDHPQHRKGQAGIARRAGHGVAFHIDRQGAAGSVEGSVGLTRRHRLVDALMAPR